MCAGLGFARMNLRLARRGARDGVRGSGAFRRAPGSAADGLAPPAPESPPFTALRPRASASRDRRLVFPAAAHRLGEIDDRETHVARGENLQRLRLEQLALRVEDLEVRRVSRP